MIEAAHKPKGRGKKPRLEKVESLRIVGRANDLFSRLRDVGTQRDTAGNRHLLYSHYASLILLSMFNPAMQSMRGLQEASELKKVQERLGIERASLGSLSESCRVFDPEFLLPLINELLADLPASNPGAGPQRHIPDTIPHELAEKLVATDGSALRALPQIIQATAGNGTWKLHLQFRPLSGRPNQASVERTHDVDERHVLANHLEAGCVYIADRGYEKYELYNRIVATQSDYVVRGQDRAATVIETQRLTPESIAARVVSDDIVTLGGNGSKSVVVDHPVRRIVIAKRDQGRIRSDRPNAEQVILYTSLVKVPAEVVAAIYELRWSIELFFRFLKQVLGLKRLFSNKTEGVTIQIYCAIIACLLLAQATGGRVSMREFRLFCFYIQGWADEEELLEGLGKSQKSSP